MTDPGSGARASTALSRFTPAELVAGAGCLALLVSLLLPWMGISSYAEVHAWSGFGIVTILVWLVVTGWFIARSPWLRNTVSLPRRTLSDSVFFVAGGAIEVVTIVIFYAEHHSYSGLHRSVQFGWVLALLGGLATAAGGYLMNRYRVPAGEGLPTTAPPPTSNEALLPTFEPPASTPPRAAAPEPLPRDQGDGPGIV